MGGAKVSIRFKPQHFIYLVAARFRARQFTLCHEVAKQIETIHPRSPIAEFNETDAAIRSEVRIYVNVGFAARIIWIFEEDEIVLTLRVVHAGSIPESSILTKQCLMNQRHETQPQNVDDEEY